MISFSERVTLRLLRTAAMLTHADTWLPLEYSVPLPNVSKLHVLYMSSVILIADILWIFDKHCRFL